MKILNPEDIKIGQWGTMCCERNLELISNKEDIDFVIGMWDDTGHSSYEVWETKKEALLTLRTRHDPNSEYGKLCIPYIDEMLKEL